MRIHIIIASVSLMVGAILSFYFAPRPKPVDKVVTKVEYIERTQVVTKTKWVAKDGTIVEQEKSEDKTIDTHTNKAEVIHVVDKFRPKMYEIGVFKEATSNKFRIMGAAQLGCLPFKFAGEVDVQRSPTFYFGAIYVF